MKLTTIDYCVHSAMAENGESDTSNYQQYLQFAYRGYRAINLTTLPTIKVVYLEISDSLTIDLPDDFVYHTAIGICLNGLIYTLTLNDKICLERKVDDCCIPITEVGANANNDAFNYGYYFLPHWRNGQYVGEAYGRGGGWNRNGYYRIDFEKNRIQFDSVVPKTEIILEYKSNGLSKKNEVCIPEEAIEPIIAYINWKRFPVGSREREIAKQDYYVAYQTMIMVINRFTMDEWRDNRYDTIKSSPKR